MIDPALRFEKAACSGSPTASEPAAQDVPQKQPQKQNANGHAWQIASFFVLAIVLFGVAFFAGRRSGRCISQLA